MKIKRLKRAIQYASGLVAPVLLASCLSSNDNNDDGTVVAPRLGLDFPYEDGFATDGRGLDLSGIALGTTSSSTPDSLDIYVNASADEDLLDTSLATVTLPLIPATANSSFIYWRTVDASGNSLTDLGAALQAGSNRFDVVARGEDAVAVASLAVTLGTSYMKEVAITQDASGNWFVLDSARKAVLRIDEGPVSSDPFVKTVISSEVESVGTGDSMSRPVDMVWDQNRSRLLVLDAELRSLFAVNPANGQRTQISLDSLGGAGNPLIDPIAMDINGDDLYLLDRKAHQIFRIDMVANCGTATTCDLVMIVDGSYIEADRNSGSPEFELRLENPVDLVFQPAVISAGLPEQLWVADRRQGTGVVQKVRLTDSLDSSGNPLIDASGNMLLDSSGNAFPDQQGRPMTDVSGNSLLAYPAKRWAEITDSSGNVLDHATVSNICVDEVFGLTFESVGKLAVRDNQLYMLDSAYTGVMALDLSDGNDKGVGYTLDTSGYTFNAENSDYRDSGDNILDADGKITDVNSAAVSLASYCSLVGDFTSITTLSTQITVDEEGFFCSSFDSDGNLCPGLINLFSAPAAIGVGLDVSMTNPRMLVLDNSLGAIVEVETVDAGTLGQREYLPGSRTKSGTQDGETEAVASAEVAGDSAITNAFMPNLIPFGGSFLATQRADNRLARIPLNASSFVDFYTQVASTDENNIVDEDATQKTFFNDPTVLAYNIFQQEIYVVDSQTDRVLVLPGEDRDNSELLAEGAEVSSIPGANASRKIASSELQSVGTELTNAIAAVVSSPDGADEDSDADFHQLFVLEGSVPSIIQVDLDINEDFDDSHADGQTDNNRSAMILGCALTNPSAMTYYETNDGDAQTAENRYLFVAERLTPEVHLIDASTGDCKTLDYSGAGNPVVAEIVDIKLDFRKDEDSMNPTPALLLLDRQAQSVYSAPLQIDRTNIANSAFTESPEAGVITGPGIPNDDNLFESAKAMAFSRSLQVLYVFDDLLNSVYVVDLAFRNPETGERQMSGDAIVTGQRLVGYRSTALNCDADADPGDGIEAEDCEL